MSGWPCLSETAIQNSCDRCNQTQISNLTAQAEWKVDNQTTDRCMSERTGEKCKIYFNVNVAAVIIAMNVVRVAIFTFVAMSMKKDIPLMNIGDAIASFLGEPDETTKGMCLELTSPRYCLILGICIIFLTQGSKSVSTSLGISTPSLRNLSRGTGNLLTNKLAVNAPQTTLSFIYVAYNLMLTTLLLAREWDQYAYHRKGLRVSSKPKGAQRSIYFLQLPYRYSVPLLLVSGTLH
ncbi:hypothetical protein BDV96DRAFT_489526 [Lophiotrema nucula]|uniref:Uncharacterized protein n=1 Tax=Lophiotrema nucula TaxID=690887 RepID=A0A6A5ZFI8_9PLEO|nr:hypothetical protein BDV96DRAFT_489526 [Lophiotrema nucula]